MSKTWLILLLFALSACSKSSLNFKGTIASLATTYLPAGVIDLSFKNLGTIRTGSPYGAARWIQAVPVVLETASGFTYTADVTNRTATNQPYRRTLIRKFDKDRNPVAAFGSGGFLEVPTLYNQDSLLDSAVIAKNRYLILAGSEIEFGNEKFVMTVFDTQTDSFLSSFGTNGFLEVDLNRPGLPQDRATAIAFDESRDSIFVAVRAVDNSPNTRVQGIMALDLTGQLQPNFNFGAPLWISVPSVTYGQSFRKFYIDPTGIIVQGTAVDDLNGYRQDYLVRITHTGVIETGFANSGYNLFTHDTEFVGAGILLGSSLYMTVSSGIDNLVIRKFNPLTGQKDMSFGTSGDYDLTPAVSGLNAIVSHILLHSSGNMYLMTGNEYSLSGYVVSLKSNFTLNTAFATEGVLALPNMVGGYENAPLYLTTVNNGSLEAVTACTNASSIRGICYTRIK